MGGLEGKDHSFNLVASSCHPGGCFFGFFSLQVAHIQLGMQQDCQALVCKAVLQLVKPQHVLAHGVIPSQMQDLAHPSWWNFWDASLPMSPSWKGASRGWYNPFSHYYVDGLGFAQWYWYNCLSTAFLTRSCSAKMPLCSSPFLYGVWMFLLTCLQTCEIQPSPMVLPATSITLLFSTNMISIFSVLSFFNIFFSFLKCIPKSSQQRGCLQF